MKSFMSEVHVYWNPIIGENFRYRTCFQFFSSKKFQVHKYQDFIASSFRIKSSLRKNWLGNSPHKPSTSKLLNYRTDGNLNLIVPEILTSLSWFFRTVSGHMIFTFTVETTWEVYMTKFEITTKSLIVQHYFQLDPSVFC